MIPIPFCGPTYMSDSLNINAQTCINLYPEVNGSDSKSAIALKGTPGLKLWTTLTGGGAIRGMYTASNNRFFAVCGNTITEIATTGIKTVRGTINSYEGVVRFSDNGIDMIVVDGAAGEGWTLLFADNTFEQITDGAYPGGTHLAFTSQVYVVNKPNTQEYYYSDFSDGTEWNGTWFEKAQGTPDNINALIAMGSDVWLFGPKSYQVSQFTGTTFELIGGTNKDIGCSAPNSVTKNDRSVFWLGGDDRGYGVVFASEGYSYRRISNFAVEQTIQRYSKLDDAIGYCYQQLGHEFYVLSFPTANITWVYDLTTDAWHQKTYTDSDGVSSMHRGTSQEFFNGKNYVGDWLSGNIYELDPDTYTDNGDLIHRERACPHIWNNLEDAYYYSFQLDVETGVGLTSGQGDDPQIMLDMSKDNGHTWGNEKWRSAGKKGDYNRRVRWTRLGASRGRVFRIKMTDPVKWTILGGFVELKG
jgi:hypothetical protein